MARTSLCLVLAGVAASTTAAFGQWSDNFDSYPSNATTNGLGGWKGWDNEAEQAGFTSTAFARSGPNSMIVRGDVGFDVDYTDAVHEYSYTSGAWRFTAHVYVPTGASGNAYFLLLNRYTDGAPHVWGEWSVQIQFNCTADTVDDDYTVPPPPAPHARTGTTLSLVRDRWVEVRCDIDLTNNTVSTFYDGQQISTGTWTIAANSVQELRLLDLFSETVPLSSGVYFDDLSIEEIGGGCDADFNGDNQVDFFDYLDFAAAFDAEDPTADFNGDNQIDFFDYLDFVAAFDACD